MFHFPTPSPFGWDDDFCERHTAASEKYNELIVDARARTALQKKRKRIRKRRSSANPLYYRDDTRRLLTLTPTRTIWYIIYVENDDQMLPRQLKKFCRRFRPPYESFKELLKDLEIHTLFSKWKDRNKNCATKLASPLPLLLLATLRYLGRG